MTVDSFIETLKHLFDSAGLEPLPITIGNELDGLVFYRGDKTYRVSHPRLSMPGGEYSLAEEVFWHLQYPAYNDLLRAFQVLQTEHRSYKQRVEQLEEENKAKTEKIDALKDKMIDAKGLSLESRKSLEALMVVATEAWRSHSKRHKTSKKDYEEKMKYLADKVSQGYE